MEIKHRAIEYAFWRRNNEFHLENGSGCWFRIFGWGLWFSNGPLSFSERNGYVRVNKLPFGWRYGILKRGKCR